MAEVLAVEWTPEGLRILDQRKLPGEEIYHLYQDPREVARSITDMEVRGAPAIGCAAAYGLALAAPQDDEGFAASAEVMRQARPTAVNLVWAVARMQACRQATQESGGNLVEAMHQEAEAIAREDEASCRAIGKHGAALVPRGAGILTHCNAGALATYRYGTALGVVRSAFARDPGIHVFVDETRPYLQGARLTAWELSRAGIPQTLITDSMAAHFMQRGRIQFVVTGADRVAVNGDAANKIGTYGLAVLAAYHQIPFFMAAPLSTFDPKVSDGAGIPIEERSSDEVTSIQGRRIAPEGVVAAHPGFDVTPHHLIQGFITEVGVLRPPFWSSIPEALGLPGQDGGSIAPSPGRR